MEENNFSRMTVLDIKNYLKKDNSVIIPVGIMEQHGYHLPTFTDSYISEGIASRIAKKMNIIYTPVLYTSYSGGCLPGTINFNPSTTIICLRDMCVSLAQQGFQNIFIIPGHGGTENMKTLENNLFIMIRENPVFEKVMITFTPFWDFTPCFRKHLEDGDGHAGDAETSMIMYLHPELVKDEINTDDADVLSELKKDPDYYQKHEKLCDYPEVLARITQKDSVRIGVMGSPEHANAEKGRIMLEEAVENLTVFYIKLLTERKEKYFEITPRKNPQS